MKSISIEDIKVIVTHSSCRSYAKKIKETVKKAQQEAVKKGKDPSTVRFFMTEDGQVVAKL